MTLRQIDQATRLRSIELVQVLLDRGARFDDALLCTDDYDMTDFLLCKGAKIIVAPGKKSALTNAAGGSNIRIVQLLLSHVDDAELEASRDALNSAAAGGRLDTVNLLIEQGFDVNAFTKDCSIGETPLLAVCQGQKPHPNVITKLLEQGADVSIQSFNGDTPREIHPPAWF